MGLIVLVTFAAVVWLYYDKYGHMLPRHKKDDDETSE
jgi:hypothetical protein